jgi:hypothetical protein
VPTEPFGARTVTTTDSPSAVDAVLEAGFTVLRVARVDPLTT